MGFRVVLPVILAFVILSLALALLSESVAVRAGETSPLLQAQPVQNAQWTVPISTPADILVLAHWLGWFGLPNHRQPVPPYLSIDPEMIKQQIMAAKNNGIDGFIVDWLGPTTMTPLANRMDRAFIDQATQILFEQAKDVPDFHIALMYDYGTLTYISGPDRNKQMGADLTYARDTYFTQATYLAYNNKPLVFLFPKPDVLSDVKLDIILTTLDTNISLIYQHPNTDSTIFPYVDGFFAWVQPTTASSWQPDGSDWGQGYLTWFYETMASSSYTQKLTVGAVWPGFNDTLAPWRTWPARFIARRDGQTWADTWDLAIEKKPPIVQIVTWNDWEEGTATEPNESHGTWVGVPIHALDMVPLWTTMSGPNAISVTLVKRAGHDNGAVRMSYHLAESPAVTKENWVQMRHDFTSLDITAGDLIRFWFSGTRGVTNSLEIGLIDSQPGQPILARQLNQIAQVPAWVYTTLSYDAFLPWTTTLTQASGQIDGLFVSALRLTPTRDITDVGGVGAVAIDGLQYLNSMSRTIPDAFASVESSPARASCSAHWIAEQQQDSGLVLSWKEQTPGRAWLYDQALALIVLSETNMTQAMTLATTLANLQNQDGSWYNGYYAETAKPLITNIWD